MRTTLLRDRGLIPMVAVIAVSAASACQLNITPGVEARDEWTRTYPLKDGGSVEIIETNGHIVLEATDGSEVSVKAERIARARTEEAAKQALKDFEMREEVTADRIAIDGTTRGISLGTGVSRRVNYTVRVPRSARVRLQSTNGDVDITGVAGRVQASTTNGDIQAVDLGDGAEIESTNGTITVALSRLGRGLRCETTNGALNITLPSGVDADFSARTNNGSIRHEGLTLSVIEQSRRRLDGTIGRGGSPVTLQTTNGSIRVQGR